MQTSSHLVNLKKLVQDLYSRSINSSDPWQRWCYDNHVLVVAKHAEELAIRYGANVAECVAGALLHDASDATMDRDDPEHEGESVILARKLLDQAGFESGQINHILDNVIAPHSCKDRMPEILEAKVVATADAIAHLTTDFYLYCAFYRIGGSTYEEFKTWCAAKVERDFHRKIFFAEVSKDLENTYQKLKSFFYRS